MRDSDNRPTDPATIAPANATARLPRVPRLSISFLLLWTAATAAVLMRLRFELLGHHSKSLLEIGITVGLSMFLGWVFSGALLIGWHTLRGTRWPLEPGEWLIVAGANAAAAILLWLRSNYLFERWVPDGVPRWWEVLVSRFSIGEIAAIYAAAAIAQRRRPWWSAALAGLCVTALTNYLLTLHVHMGDITLLAMWSACVALVTVLVIAGVVADHRRKETRHWLHWSGWLLTLVSMYVFIGFMCALIFIFL